MSPEMLLKHFDAVADAPGGVQRLRELILQLAVRGKLVPQDPRDEPASVLLERIEAEKRRLHAEGKIRKPKRLPPIKVDEVPFEVPEGWCWTCLGRVGEIVGGGTPKSTVPIYWADDDVPWLTPADLRGLRGKLIARGKRDISREGLESSSARLLPEGSVLFSSRAPIGYVAIAEQPIATNQGFKSCVPYISGLNQYLYWYLTAVAPEIDRNAPGTTFREVSGKILSRVLLTLPPLPEQHRIVEKVDQIMALCDELEARQRRRVQKRDRLNRAVLHHLTTAGDDGGLTHGWARIRENFDLLYDAPEAVEELRQAVLQLAVRGKLVPQDLSDEPASVLLERIEAEKRRLFAEGKTGKQKKLPPIKVEEVPFEVPEGWVWARFGDLSINRDSERVPVSAAVREGRKGIFPYYGASGIIDHVDDYLFDERLLLIGEDGANLILRSTPIAFLADGKYWVNNHAHVMDAPEDRLLDYLALFINATDLRPYVTGTAQPKLNQVKLNSIAVAVPPLPEQCRIVERVDQLMSRCDELEAKLTHARTKSEHLAAAVVHHLTAA